MTPVAPTVPTALSSANSAVALSALDDPISALIATGQFGLNYLINGSYSEDPVVNWGEAAGIGDFWNAVLQEVHDPVFGFVPHITSVGVIPNSIEVPFPVGTQFLANVVGYGNTAAQATGDVLQAGADVVWVPVSLTGAVIADLLSGNVDDIPADVQDAIDDVLASLTGALDSVVFAGTDIVNNVIARAGAVIEAITVSLQELGPILTYQLDYLSFATNNVVTGLTDALAAGDLEGAWNAGVAGLLGPDGLPGVMLNLSVGAGIQIDTEDPNTFVPSLRTAFQSSAQKIASALTTTVSPTEEFELFDEPESAASSPAEVEADISPADEPPTADASVGDLAYEPATGDAASEAGQGSDILSDSVSDSVSETASVTEKDTDSGVSATRAQRGDRQAAAADNAESPADK
ncbi:hypothetical protein [Mycolicibacterium sp.]|uniref:hypothetical protein n=1 Tax=Mycolicibacterium sp. TaxID=2320850 RepID=UPI0028B01212|nr:hypothetical protein [Mycolicibacterium sp.]